MSMNAKLSDADLDLKNKRIRPRHLRIINEKNEKPTEFFYRVDNLNQLAKIGHSYVEDFQNGIKSFAISSTNYKASQQRTVLALASYFDHMFDMKILIVSDSLQKGVFDEVMTTKTVEQVPVLGTSKKIEVNHFFHHFDLVDLNKLLNLTKSERPTSDFKVIMDHLVNEYDIIFWDTPIINTHKNNSRIYSHIMSYLESLTIVVSPTVSKASDVNEIKKHFSSFGVNVKGVLFDSPEIKDRSRDFQKAANLE